MVLVDTLDPFAHNCSEHAISDCCDAPVYTGYPTICDDCRFEAYFTCSFCGADLEE